MKPTPSGRLMTISTRRGRSNCTDLACLALCSRRRTTTGGRAAKRWPSSSAASSQGRRSTRGSAEFDGQQLGAVPCVQELLGDAHGVDREQATPQPPAHAEQLALQLLGARVVGAGGPAPVALQVPAQLGQLRVGQRAGEGGRLGRQAQVAALQRHGDEGVGVGDVGMEAGDEFHGGAPELKRHPVSVGNRVSHVVNPSHT